MGEAAVMNRDDIFAPQSDDNIGRMALIEAVRANTDAVSRMARQGEAQGGKLDAIGQSLHALDRRLALIENNTIERDLERLRNCTHELESRIDVIEAREERRTGAMGLFEWVGRNWPVIVGATLLIAVLMRERIGL